MQTKVSEPKKFDLILTSYEDFERTWKKIYAYVSLPPRTIRDLLKNVPVRIVYKEQEFHVKRFAQRLEEIGCKVKILPCR